MRIGIVNDSLVALQSLSRIIAAEADMTVAWMAHDGLEAVAHCRENLPDLVLMDMIMPGLDGVDATRQIMQETPCPILVVTGSVDLNLSAVFAAMGAGALDVISTPPFGAAEAKRLLLEKIRNIAAICDFKVKMEPQNQPAVRSRSCVIIGSSAGGPTALMDVLTLLPPMLPTSIVIIQHIDLRFSSELASWLGGKCAMPVRVAEENEELVDGSVLIAKGGIHLTFTSDQRLHFTNKPTLPYQPSVDVFMDSALQYGPNRLLGVLLTGMGRDGAKGLKAMRTAGHTTIAQDQASSAIYGMPRAAAEMDAASEILPLAHIARRIVDWSNS